MFNIVWSDVIKEPIMPGDSNHVFLKETLNLPMKYVILWSNSAEEYEVHRDSQLQNVLPSLAEAIGYVESDVIVFHTALSAQLVCTEEN